MKITLDPGAYMPERAHATDAGLDIRSMEPGIVPAKGSRFFHTGVHVELPAGTAGLMVSRSGMNRKHRITSTGLIDQGYTGEIGVMLYNDSNSDFVVWAGDKITQLVVIPVRYEDLELVCELADTPRGTNGFGSTGISGREPDATFPDKMHESERQAAILPERERRYEQ